MPEPISAVTSGAQLTVAPLTGAPEIGNDTPFQKVLDGALNALEDVSKLEQKSDLYIREYVRGNVSMEDVLIETTKMQLAMDLTITLVNQAVSTFKEIQQMQV